MLKLKLSYSKNERRICILQLYAKSAGEIVGDVFSNLLFWGTIVAAVVVISLGFIFQKKKVIFQDWEKTLVKVIVFVGLPALILKTFMSDLTVDIFKNMIILFALGILFYLVLSLGTRVFFLKNKKSVQDTLSMCVAFSSTIYFGLPIARTMFSGAAGLEVDQAQNMFNVGYWAFMCSYALYIIRRKVDGVSLDGKKLKTKLGDVEINSKKTSTSDKFSRKDLKSLILSPIILALIIGFILWVMQLIPGINLISVTDNGWNTINPGKYSITRIDALIPGVSQILTALSALPTPLAWLAVGAVVAKGNIKKAIKNKLAWYGALLKNLFVPLFALGLVAMFAAIGHAANDAFTISAPALVVIVLMAASPTATTVCGYAILYDKEALTASEICTLTTLLATITMPIWAIVVALVSASDIFLQIP